MFDYVGMNVCIYSTLGFDFMHVYVRDFVAVC